MKPVSLLFNWLLVAAVALCAQIPLPAYPLAVKNPYLSAWLPGGSSGPFPTTQPFFWARQSLTWLALARVNGQAYCLLGCKTGMAIAATQTNRTFTSTHTLVTLQAGGVSFLLDFFSPVSLTDYVRQSIPLSYLTVTVQQAKSSDEIFIMSAIDDSWLAQNETRNQLAFSTTQNSLLYQISATNPTPLHENGNMATYGQVVFAATKTGAPVTYQVGSVQDVLTQFKSHGNLTSPSKPNYASGNVVAYAYQILHPTIQPVNTFAVGFTRDPTVLWLGAPQAAYYQSEFGNTADLVDHFFADLAAARSESNALDTKVRSMGATISSNYADILEASVRQIWGGFELTVPMDTKDTSQARAFMKEISTDGNVNTLADLLPKVLPAFYVLAPEYIRLLLKPVMEYTLQWPAQYAFHDLGKHYPNASGETVAGEEMLLLDQTSVIQWMAYAYQKASGNTNFAKPYLAPLEKYAKYLAQNGLYPPSQKSSVDSIGATPNQTILAIYSAIGLTAFGALSGETTYTQQGQAFAPQILKLGTDSQNTHLKAHYYDPDSSWITAYPFAYDVMLGLNTFNASVRQQQSNWYLSHMHDYGMQFYSGVNYTVADLAIWCAATSSIQVLNDIVDGIHNVLVSGINVVVGPTQWNVVGPKLGQWFESTAKSNVGSFFMPLAMRT